MTETTPVSELEEDEVPLQAGRSKAVLWVLGILLIVVAAGVLAMSTMSGSVMFYRTPTEVAEQRSKAPVRMAGYLVPESVRQMPNGETIFEVTDWKTTMTVLYQGGATTALTTASKPGTQMVAEGAWQSDGRFAATMLLAKCPSKFSNAVVPEEDD